MRKVVLINSFNYSSYILDCVSSVINQSVAVDLIIVVDDGSADETVEILKKKYSSDSRFVLLQKPNAGQLSCFNFVCGLIKDDDLVFFLDADDLYLLDYVENILKNFQLGDEFIFCDAIKFSRLSELVSAVISKLPPIIIDESAYLTKITGCWIGSPTSAIVIRGCLFNRLFPYPITTDWITRADDVIVFGASLLGATKKYLPSLGIAYRVHSNNNFYGKKISYRDMNRRYFKLDRLFSYYWNARYGRKFIYRFAFKELNCIPKSVRSQFFIPDKIIILLRPIRNYFSLFKELFK